MSILSGGTGTSDEPIEKLRRDLVRDGINDIQGSIHANDTKSSAALVVHGLLFAGVLAVSRELGHVYENAQSWQQATIVAVLSIALAAFLYSVWELTRAVRPYHPSALRDRIAADHPQLFFPLMWTLGRQAECDESNELVVYLAKLRKASESEIDADYSAELLKLAAIRRHQADRARAGYRALRVELAFVAAFLIFVAFVAMSQTAA